MKWWLGVMLHGAFVAGPAFVAVMDRDVAVAEAHAVCDQRVRPSGR